MAYVQSPCTSKRFFILTRTCFTRPLTSNGLVFHSLTNNDKVFPLA
ncbi:uncharacterized protein G2W53_002014 [Senna tora]|uniref:Uncharacterized protein n=1 Tax=Senna tora TaxID=362788 RepID=A0A834XH07_9FABA|nr:uncharacterized protein G2W53_002014 [Senna tora]